MCPLQSLQVLYPSLCQREACNSALCDAGVLLGRVTGVGNNSILQVLCQLATHAPDSVSDSGVLLGRVIDALGAHAKEAGCYKVILDCGEANVVFYEKCGLARKEVQMVGYSLIVHLAALCGSRDHRHTAAQSLFGTVSGPALSCSVLSIDPRACSHSWKVRHPASHPSRAVCSWRKGQQQQTVVEPFYAAKLHLPNECLLDETACNCWQQCVVDESPPMQAMYF